MNFKEGITPLVLAIIFITHLALANEHDPKRMKCKVYGCSMDTMILQDVGYAWEISFIKNVSGYPLGENFQEFTTQLGFHQYDDNPDNVVLEIEKKYCQESRWGMRALNCNGPVKRGNIRVRVNQKFAEQESTYEIKQVSSQDKKPWGLFLKTLSFDPKKEIEWSMALTHDNVTTDLGSVPLWQCEQNP